jgi:hypothetical protein
MLKSVILFVFLSAVAIAGPAASLPAFRAIQFDRRRDPSSEAALGSRGTVFRGPAALYPFGSASWKGRVAVFASVLDGIQDSISALESEGAAAVWLMGIDLTSTAAAAPLSALDEFITTNAIEIPVYLTPSSSESLAMLRRLQEGGEMLTMTEKTLPVPSASAMLQSTVAFATIATNTAKAAIAAKKDVPTLLLTATVDTLGAFPHVSTGDLSGAAALMDLHRVFSKALESPTADFAVQFLVTNSGRLNYGGTKAWMAQRRGEELDAVDFALSLDSLTDGTSSAKMYLHTSKPFANGTAARTVVELLVSEGKARGIEVEFVMTKFDATRSEVGFEHEILAHKKVPAVTVSAFSQPSSQITRFSHSARQSPAAVAAIVAQRVAWLHAVALAIIEVDAKLFTTPSETYVAGWLDYGRRAARPFFDPSVMNAVGSAFREKAIRSGSNNRGLKITTNLTTVTTATGAITLYMPSSTEGTKILLYTTKSTQFEVAILAAVVGYLIVFTVSVGGVAGLRQVLRL